MTHRTESPLTPLNVAELQDVALLLARGVLDDRKRLLRRIEAHGELRVDALEKLDQWSMQRHRMAVSVLGQHLDSMPHTDIALADSVVRRYA